MLMAQEPAALRTYGNLLKNKLFGIVFTKLAHFGKRRLVKGFTLLELIVVIIILGILASIGFIQYAAVVEKGRRAEAAVRLDAMRSLAIVRFQEIGSYPDNAYISTNLFLPTTSMCDSINFFWYSINTAGRTTATRCITGSSGRVPLGATADELILGIDGTRSSSPTGLW